MVSESSGELDYRKRPRRRGETLNAAIFQATLDELAETGYAALTMERVAERAQASKASLYRRWPSRIELVRDAVQHVMPQFTSTPDTGSLRGDLLAAPADRRTAGRPSLDHSYAVRVSYSVRAWCRRELARVKDVELDRACRS